jgi:hypothetical protein
MGGPMNKPMVVDKYQVFEKLLEQTPPADWVRNMIEHYRRTGTFRPQDLRRLLGDPTEGVEIGPNSSLASNLATHKAHGS